MSETSMQETHTTTLATEVPHGHERVEGPAAPATHPHPGSQGHGHRAATPHGDSGKPDEAHPHAGGHPHHLHADGTVHDAHESPLQ